MGKTTRWIWALFVDGKKEKKNTNGGNGGEEKKRWSFRKSWRDKGNGSPAVVVKEKENDMLRRRRDFYLENEEQSKHAIAIAAATAAAADAAVVSAQAAVAVVKLTSYGGRRRSPNSGSRESWSAVKIQSFFRGYLARKALRALKALVKLQALVRGYLVRKRLTMAIQTMQALLRAKSNVRARRSNLLPVRDQTRFHPEIRHRRSVEKSEEAKSDHSSSFRGRRLSTTTTTVTATATATSMDASSLNSSEDSPRVVEIDSIRTRSARTRRFSSSTEDSSSAEKQDGFFTRTTPTYRCSVTDECRFSTTHNTPRLPSSGSLINGGTLEAARKINWNPLCSPNYMNNTLSFRAKVRSQSAPKQRIEAKRRELVMDAVDSRASVTDNIDRRLSWCDTRDGYGSTVKKVILGHN